MKKDESDAWRDIPQKIDKIKDVCIGTIFIVYMVLEDLKDKVNLINTIIPVGYWISRINTDNFLWDFRFDFLLVGIFLTAIQLYYQDIFERQLGSEKIEIKKLASGHFLHAKQNKTAFVFSLIIYGYGIISFYFMWTGLKNDIVWTLISFYLIGVLFIVFKSLQMIRYERDTLERIGKIIRNK